MANGVLVTTEEDPIVEDVRIDAPLQGVAVIERIKGILEVVYNFSNFLYQSLLFFLFSRSTNMIKSGCENIILC